MICRLTGRVEVQSEQAARVQIGPIGYEVLMSAHTLGELARVNGGEMTLTTLQYLEGNPAIGNLTPRLIGFLDDTEREFFHELIRVKGISMRRALRAMAVPVRQIAAAIENGDERTLTTLPEIGKKMAGQMVAELRGRLTKFLSGAAAPAAIRELSDGQLQALEILVSWGDRRADAQRWIAAAVEADAGMKTAEEIVRAAYKVKARAP